MNELRLFNRQKRFVVSTPEFRRIVRNFLAKIPGIESWQLGFHLVEAEEIAALNWKYLKHKGSTDVITFDHREENQNGQLHGEIFICVDDAARFSDEFKTSWQSEIVRYAVHGILHLQGYSDHAARDRKVMKKEEDQSIRLLGSDFDFSRLGRKRAG